MARPPLLQLTDISLTFGGDPVFDGLNLVVQPGDRAALVGRNGSGKSTLLNLTLRFFDIDTGSITIDGQNICDVSLDSLRAATALVTQETFLFDDTIAKNIAFGKVDATKIE